MDASCGIKVNRGLFSGDDFDCHGATPLTEYLSLISYRSRRHPEIGNRKCDCVIAASLFRFSPTIASPFGANWDINYRLDLNVLAFTNCDFCPPLTSPSGSAWNLAH
jgi:hypothetical protein